MYVCVCVCVDHLCTNRVSFSFRLIVRQRINKIIMYIITRIIMPTLPSVMYFLPIAFFYGFIQLVVTIVDTVFSRHTFLRSHTKTNILETENQ
jgi:hypothetical protein